MSTEQPESPNLQKKSVDKDLGKLGQVEDATQQISRKLIGPGLGLLFLAVAGIFASTQIGNSSESVILIIAAVLGGYMALNIGANDVANNVGPAVGSKALTIYGALVVAAIFECAGALLAGGDVVKTISKGIIDPNAVASSQIFIWAMLSALMASALWVNLATWIGAPVSTTHAVVGGVLGAGIASSGLATVNWPIMGAIAASWVISPLLGGVIAAGFLAFIKIFIIYQDDKIAAARRWVPWLIALMVSAFSAYLMMKGLKRIWKPDMTVVVIGAIAMLLGSWLLLNPAIARQSEGLENRNQSLRKLFRYPLICSAALLSFAHGANDVANAVGPLAAILSSAQTGEIAAKVELPIWVMLIGGIGISVGLFLFGPRLIIMVGQQITRMNPMRAFCVSLSAAITVIIASGLGLPVSSTHIAVGAVFGVGFFREHFTARSKRRRKYVNTHPEFHAHGGARKPTDPQELIKRKLVRRSHFLVILAAWLITVPAAASISAMIFFAISMMQ
ncbi:MAG: inorganic phosphate transporter [Hyphomicrobiaceae bacterium]